ncbi:MAG: ATP-binding cassette domain-containing protein [Firmicutes bacterium]|nr:ATP-binding cassette domain-containing protein [Bacillota bacterium]
MSIIQVRDLVRKYKDFLAVKGVTFDVPEGEIFGFLGPNGAGKSTTIQILATLLKPTEGTAVVNGFDIRNEPDKVRQSIGLVFQDPSLDERLTARENLYFHAMLYNVETTIMKKRMAEVLEMVELADRQKDQVKTFSGGMRRRLEIARGLVHYPKVLFLDEPTVGLDPQTRKRIWEYIHYLRDKEGLTIFLTTHYMDEAENCQRIAVIDHGEIVALDTPENLKSVIGGDVIKISTDNNEEVLPVIKSRLQVKAEKQGDYIAIQVEKGETFIPRLAVELNGRINSMLIKKPSLDDVFLHLTGREIREEGVNAVDRMRVYAKRKR